VPFGLFKRGADQEAAKVPEAPASAGAITVRFDGLTEEWRLVGEMHLHGRLSDALNRRGAITISDVAWAPVDGSVPMEQAPGLRSVDPYDLVAVFAGDATLPILSETERAAHKIHKIPYDVGLEAPPLRIIGTVYLYPGSEPDRLMDRATELFVPVTDAVVYVGEQRLDGVDADVVLVNRSYLRSVQQVDRRTEEPVRPLPGQPLGGISWRDRAK
jgi:hypothetical protein